MNVSEHNTAQKEHYENQYGCDSPVMEYDERGDLWDWARWYPLLAFEGFVKSMSGESLVATCCGAGRELGMLHKHGVNVTATDLTVTHLANLAVNGVIVSADEQNAERLGYEDDSFDYGFVNAGLHHLAHPHAGLNELMRVGRKAAIFIENQDSFLHSVGKFFGRNADFEPAGNYVYRWKFREIEKIALSSHAYGFAVKTNFLPVLNRMRGVTGSDKQKWQARLAVIDRLLGRVGNLLIAVIFKRPPTTDQLNYIKGSNFRYVDLTSRYPEFVTLRK